MGKKHSTIKGLYQQKSGWFYFQPPTPKDGVSKRPTAIALGTKNFAEAVILLEEKRNELHTVQAARRMTVDEVLPRYLKEKSRDSEKSVRQRTMVLNSFSSILGNPKITAITCDTIEEWREHVIRHGANSAEEVKDLTRNGRKKRPKMAGKRSQSTVKSYTIIVKAFFNWAVREGLIKTSPVAKLARQTRVAKTRVNDFLTEEEREAALSAEAPDYIRFILHFGFLAGLRDGEMLAMTPDWLWISKDGKQGTVTIKDQKFTYQNGQEGIWRPKTREMRTIPLHPRILSFLQEYGMRKPWMLAPQKVEWPNPGMTSKRFDCHRALAGLAKRHGIRKLNYHILRHSFATHLVMKGVSLAEVAGLLGDTLQVTEQNYAGYSPSRANPVAVL